MYLLKEYKASFKDNLFDSIDKCPKMFTIINKNGNLAILKEVFKFYPNQYVQFLEQNLTNLNESNMIYLNTIGSQYQCLEFNLRLLEKT